MLRFVSMLLLLTLAAGTGHAQDAQDAQDAQVYHRYRLPDSTTVLIEGERHQAFNLGGYRDLLTMDADLRFLALAHETDTLRIQALTEAATEYTLALDETNQALELLQEDRERLQLLWEEENRLRHTAENRPDYSWIPWTISAGLAVAVVALGVVVGVQ